MMNSHRIYQKTLKAQRGLAAVELTIALPVLLLLFLATAEFGKALYDYNTLTKAQRNGIRYLAANARTGLAADAIANTMFINNATNLVVFGNIAGSGDPLLPDFTTTDVVFDDPTSDEVRVTVSYDYSPMVFDSLPTFGIGGDFDLTFTFNSSITMRALIGG